MLDNISIATENSGLENPKVAALGTEIFQILEKAMYKLNSEDKSDIYEEFFNDESSIKAIFGIKGELKYMPKWECFKLSHINNPKI